MPSIINALTASGGGVAITGDATGNLALQTAGNTAVTVNTSKGVQFDNCIGVGNATPSTSGAGITFPATQSASTDANTLDDYEEGTFSPTLQGSTTAPSITYVNQQGIYTKVGNLVTVSVAIEWSAFSGGSGLLFIGNLPFSSAASPQFQGGGSLGYASGFPTNALLYMDSATARFVLIRAGTSITYISVPDVSSAGLIMAGMSYRV